jgi:hypothetical protein
MKKITSFACLFILISGQIQSQIFINTTASTNNTDPTYRMGSVSIGKTSAAVEKLDVEGNIGIPYGSYFGLSNSNIPYRRLMSSAWDGTNGHGDCLAFYTSGTSPLNQYEKMRITMAGKVGIGTDNPKARLHVYESTALPTGSGQFMPLTSVTGNTGGNAFHHNQWLVRNSSGLGNWWDVRLHDGISIDNTLNNPTTNTKTWWTRDPYADQQFWGNDATTYMQLDKGRLGINRTTPSARLDISENDNNFITLLARDYHTTDGKYCIMASVTRDLTKAFTVGNNLGGSYKEPFVVYGNGQTQIGLQKPQSPHNDAMLSVDGKIASKSLYVLKPTSWADFVFDQKQSENLSEVESYINANKHLPGVPSEQEIIENGYDINVMDAKLLEKIESLYLHIIKLEKEINTLKNK